MKTIGRLLLDYGLAVLVFVLALHRRGAIHLPLSEKTTTILATAACLIFAGFWTWKSITAFKKLDDPDPDKAIWSILDICFSWVTVLAAISLPFLVFW